MQNTVETRVQCVPLGGELGSVSESRAVHAISQYDIEVLHSPVIPCRRGYPDDFRPSPEHFQMTKIGSQERFSSVLQPPIRPGLNLMRSEEHTSELQSP